MYSYCSFSPPNTLKFKRKKKIPPTEVAKPCNYEADGERGGCVVLMCMKTNVYLWEMVLFLSTESVLACSHFLFYVTKTAFIVNRRRRVDYFCLYLLYVMISYLYSSIVEISCHFFHGCGLLAEMPYTFCAVSK